MSKVSVVMIVKNEEQMLPRCLESVRDLDEIIVLDTGSSDHTCEVARKAGGNVRVIEGEYAWEEDFSKARNKAQEYATGDWIFVIDADEELPVGEAERIREAIEKNPDAPVIDCWVQHKGGVSRHRSPRLYKNNGEIKWAGSVHNYLSRVASASSGVLVRAGYSPTHKTDPNRALRMLEAACANEPGSSRNWYYMGREYGYKKRWADSESSLRQCLTLSKWPAERADALLLLARALWFQMRGPEARKACLDAIGTNPDFKEALLFMGTMSHEKGRKIWHAYAGLAQSDGVLFRRVE